MISNIQPIISNDILIEGLKGKGIKILSNINEIRASSSKSGRSHIISFRRQFFIEEEDEQLLPETLQLTYENTTYWTYLTTDSAACVICKQTGHISKVCPEANLNIQNFVQIPSKNEKTTNLKIQRLTPAV